MAGREMEDTAAQPEEELHSLVSTPRAHPGGRCSCWPVRKTRGVLLLLLFVVTTMATCIFVFLPTLLLHVLSPWIALRIFQQAGNAWYAVGALLLQVLGIDVRVTSNAPLDELDADRGAVLIVVNHFSRLDWIMLWMLELRHGWGSSKVAVLKDDLRHMPGPGWAMQFLRYLFVSRKWDVDQHTMQQGLLSVCRDGGASVLLFPEGTDRSASNVRRSQDFARSRGLAVYSKVLHPRTRGFIHIAETMSAASQLRAVWDVTMGVVGMREGAGEADLLGGNWPSAVHFHVRRYQAAEAVGSPATDEHSDAWLRKRWAAKEAELTRFENAGEAMLGEESVTIHDHSSFPWGRWLCSGSVLYLAFSLYVVPVWILTTSWGQIWGAVGVVVCGACAPLAGGWDQLLQSRLSLLCPCYRPVFKAK
eukprot:COSAG02_NODE_516_length_20804_cov_162.717460_1_plen_419_part_00